MIAVIVAVCIVIAGIIFGPFRKTELGKKLFGMLDLVCLLINVRFAQILRQKLGLYIHFSDYFDSLVKKHANRIALISAETRESVTYSQYDMLSNQFSHYGIQLGLKPSDVIAVYMSNSFEFLYCWIGMAKIGIVSGLINTNLSGKPLIHALNLALEGSSTKICIVSSDLIHHFNDHEVKQCISQSGIKLVVIGPSDEYTDSYQEINKLSTSHVKNTSNGLKFKSVPWNDPMLLIYTSGTTGLPKASKISSGRFILAGFPMMILGHYSSSDRIYCALPLYHSGGGLVVISCAMQCGASIVMRKKFSVSNFAREYVETKCTTLQYIGEFCRYLVNSPPTDYDKQVHIRVAYGNGMRAEVWTRILTKYNMTRILEFYGSTEGNVMLFNVTGKIGALGYIYPLFDPLYPVISARINDDTSELIRDANGLCVPCKFGEVGHILGRIQSTGKDSVRGFEGYTDVKATSKKICHHVLQFNDKYFMTWDLMRRDADGYYYWVDRIGDTYRWKGENVSTGEVEEILASIDVIEQAVVYGVEIPGCDGRAGMACISLKSEVDGDDHTRLLVELNALVSAQLPSYARPLFVRITRDMKMTSTFKPKKKEMVDDGFNPSNNKDVLFYLDIKANAFKPLTQEVNDKIISGLIKY